MEEQKNNNEKNKQKKRVMRRGKGLLYGSRVIMAAALIFLFSFGAGLFFSSVIISAPEGLKVETKGALSLGNLDNLAHRLASFSSNVAIFFLPGSISSRLAVTPFSEVKVNTGEEVRVLAEEDTLGGGSAEAEFTSENYKINQISIGGGSIVVEENERAPLSVSDIRSEIVTNKETGEIKVLVFWKTNKLASSEVEYSKQDSIATKTINEDQFGFVHSALLSNLEPSTAYTFQIKSKDRWANDVTSEKFAVYSGAKEVSIMDLLMEELGAIFGWALK